MGVVYPPHVPPGRWLETYASMFPIVEIDSTFYALPSEQTVDSWVRRSQSLPGFRFTAKVPQDVTHRHLARGALADAKAVLAEFERIVLAPLEAADRLEGVLVQLPPTFALYEEAGATDPLDALLRVVEALGPKARRVAVEFRHQSWFEHVGERLVPDVLEAMSAVGASVVYVDGLGSRLHGSRTARWSYVRLHGRRTDLLPGERTLSHAPYNYLYNSREIGEIGDKVRQLQAQDERTIVIFNNHYRGQAARNAMDLMEALGLGRPKPAVPFARETKLDQFGS